MKLMHRMNLIEIMLISFWPAYFLGLNKFVYHIFAMFMLFSIIRRRVARFRIVEISLLLYISANITSLLVNLAISESNMLVRAVAAVSNLSVMVIGLIVLLYCHNDKTDLRRVPVIIFWNQVIFACLGIIFSVYSIHNSYTIKLPSLLYIITQNDFFNLLLVRPDWMNSLQFPRLVLGFDYPNAIGGFELIHLPISFMYLKGINIASYFKGPIKVFLCVPLALSLSRSAILLFTLMVITHSATKLIRNIVLKQRVIILIILFFSSLFSLTLVQNILVTLDRARGNSSDTRYHLYQLTIERFYTSPIIGVGIKYYDGLKIPLGSHSTYLGAIYKSGLFGALLFLPFWVSIIRRHISLATKSYELSFLAYGILGFIAWLTFEDLDALPNLAMLFFIAISYTNNYSKTIGSKC